MQIKLKLSLISLTILLTSSFVVSMQNQSSNNNLEQHPWTVDNVRGYSMDTSTNEIDETEGFGAFDSLVRFSNFGPRNLDNGGGSYDDNSTYVKEKYNVNNLVYDPFKRNCEHNLEVIKTALNNPFDTCTSMSVLNVIDTKQARLDHIKMCYNAIKPNGKAFFKVWSGNNSGQDSKEPGRYQSNKGLEYYIDEVREIFGTDNVMFDQKNDIIIATKV